VDRSRGRSGQGWSGRDYRRPEPFEENLIQFVLPNGALLSVARIVNRGVTTTEVAVVNGAGGFVPVSVWRSEPPRRPVDENIIHIGTGAHDLATEIEFAETWATTNRRMLFRFPEGFHFAPE
jgi:hypothetical protein